MASQLQSTVPTEVPTVQLFIGGKLVDAASGETFDADNPATKTVIAHVAKAAKEDVDRAVQAAHVAFDDGPWPRMAPYQRGGSSRRSPISSVGVPTS